MYSKFGYIGFADEVFDKMTARNESSWNNMMSGLVRAGLYGDAMGLFNEMRGFGICPGGFAFASLITGCDRSSDMFSEGVQVHGLGIKNGILCDVYVGTSLLHFYGSYGLAFNSRQIFEEMPHRNVVSWTALMVAYSDYGDPVAVIDAYKQMRRERVSCNDNTLATVVCSCGSLGDELLGQQVFGQVIKLGLDTNVSVPNSLISMFGSFGRVDEASFVFGRMSERDTISWNSMISEYVHNGLCEESLRCFSFMRRIHNGLDSTTVSALLSGSGYGSLDTSKWGRGLHCLIIKYGLDSNVCVCNTLISMYSDTGKSKDAELVFQGMMERDLISWNSMMACYAQAGNCHDALKLFARIFRARKATNHVTFTSAIAACTGSDMISEGKILHSLVILSGLHENVIVGNALVTFYSKSRLVLEAEKVFQAMSTRDEVTWNALIGGYADNGEPDKAIETLKLLRKEYTPSYITICNLLGASCLTPNDLLTYGMPIHAYIILSGFESDKFVENSLITMYAKCGDIGASNYIFDGLTEKNSATWNAIISANAHHGCLEEALKLLVNMRRAGINLDEFSLSECLATAAKLAILEEGQQLHSLVIKLCFDSNPFVTNALVDMYGKCGELEDVLEIIPQPLERSQLSWNILISSFARHGLFDKAKETFHEMIMLGVKPSHVTFVSLLSACSHGGLVDDGLAYYNSMTKEFGVLAGIEHCVCIVDLLGRAGKLKEAEAFINEMPVPPTDLIWRSLLSACKIHGDLELGKRAAEQLLKLDPSDDSAYVLYSNVCASTGRWNDVEGVRRKMGSNKIKKKPACSWVKLKNELSSFGIGDRSHPQTNQIYSKLEELKKLTKEAGYLPDTSYALHDTDEEQKEQNLWNHSERLALAYGLINTPEGSTIKIFKNLRVCGDCHSVFKFASGILGRKIILRDPYRFHHFGDGSCSCSDYW